MKRIIEYIKAVIILIKAKGQGRIWYCSTIKRYIVFCDKCGEYICNDGMCSNPFHPERIIIN